MATRKTAKTPKPADAKAGTVRKPVKGAEPVIRRRFWLTYPVSKIKAPVIWELGHRFPLVTNIRQASITDEVGIVCLEVEGSNEAVDAGLRWMKKLGLSVEPVELSTVAG